jgi:hypothetical protein
MRLALFLLAATVSAAEKDWPLSREEAAAGWIRLFDGSTTFGWEPSGPAWEAAGGVLRPPAAGGMLASHTPFGDFRLTLEFNAGRKADAGLLLRAAGVGANPGDAIELVLAGEEPPGSLRGRARAKSSIGRGDWRKLDLTVRGSRYLVRLDGKPVLDQKIFTAATGFLILRAGPGGGLELRELRLRPLDMACLLNGKDLAGWKQIDAPRAQTRPEWSVRDGVLHVEKGPGELKSERAWDDFILQMEIRVNSTDPARHPNSGLFFRGDIDVYGSGYESQIRNEFAGGDPARPVDFGTGGIYRHQPARRVASRDNEWFTKTVAASGRRIAVWVEGYPVTAWTDARPEGRSVRAGQARLFRGTLSLQAHDPTTNLDFRNLCIAPLRRP